MPKMTTAPLLLSEENKRIAPLFLICVLAVETDLCLILI